LLIGNRERSIKYDLTVFIRLFKGSSRALKAVYFLGFAVDSLDSSGEPHHPRFLAQDHIQGVRGDALREDLPKWKKSSAMEARTL
jgi:hypothetical protein